MVSGFDVYSDKREISPSVGSEGDSYRKFNRKYGCGRGGSSGTSAVIGEVIKYATIVVSTVSYPYIYPLHSKAFCQRSYGGGCERIEIAGRAKS